MSTKLLNLVAASNRLSRTQQLTERGQIKSMWAANDKYSLLITLSAELFGEFVSSKLVSNAYLGSHKCG